MSTATSEFDTLASLTARFLEGIATGRISLEIAEEFVNSGRIDTAPGAPAIGSIISLPCPTCHEETHHVFVREAYSSRDLFGPSVFRWTCHQCTRKGPPIVITKKE